ncbi:hypothetical protein TWF694_005427 [Orbilia ellipsospora]|uniref:Polyketide synthase n=1 Tax=Orbilia ellipsospora TaxID=2528407 RepID=A0AAV9WU57_9PEZI
MTSSQPKTMPIAITGMACRFAGDANNLDKFWDICATAQNTWSEWPKDRLNQAAFFHPRPETLGAMHSSGGHFLNDDPSLCDTSFFGFTADMAKGMDPQIRMLLETTFEAFESAGLSLENVAGSSTSVFAGAMFHDYEHMIMQDVENLPRHYVMGNGQCMLANRLSHFFDLRGPSVSVDTACSSTMTALHLACQSLRTGESSMAVVGGATLMLYPAASIGVSSIGLTGPDGKSYAFDSRASGYGRGEGIASIILKPLDAALRDNDPIRAVIRETAMNQDGRTPTITSPSQEAQETLIREIYENAGLDLKDTTYVECHGTGTIAGDTTETSALGNSFASNLNSSASEPLFVGSVKANFGHTEAASGLAAIIKTTLMMEKGFIPPQALFATPNPRIDFDALNIKIPTELMPWPKNRLRRVSLNNFGAGGTNTHAIIEAAEYHLPPKVERSKISHNDNFLIALSCKEEKGVRAFVREISEYLKGSEANKSIADIAYTLSERRSKLPWRAVVLANSVEQLQQKLENSVLKPKQVTLAKPPRLGFIFTGQGAQWHAMGRELIAAYPVFRNALERADKQIKLLGSPWNVFEELLKDEKTTRVNLPLLSSLTVIVQIALVELLRSWGITPTACTGHSSGEISAAYGAGFISFEDAVTLSYMRGYVIAEFVDSGILKGSMSALALGKEAATEYIQNIKVGTSVIACVNSPKSVTVAGDITALEEIEAKASSDGIFCRRLKVPAAYHSPYMQALAKDYSGRIKNTCFQQEVETSRLRVFASSVTGRCVSDPRLVRDPEHWVRNMIQCVEFEESLKAIVLKEGKSSIPSFALDTIIEVGPSGALKGPIRQTLSDPELSGNEINIDTCLQRNENAVLTLQGLAGRLFCDGYPVRFSEVNLSDADSLPRVITDLPRYQWNHQAKYWAASFATKHTLERAHPRHDLLGVPIKGLNPEQHIWRNTLRISDVPWLQDHSLQGEAIFPGAGWGVIVMEAMRQIHPLSSSEFAAYALTDVELSTACVIPNNDEGIELQVIVRKQGSKILDHLNRKEFYIYSLGKDGNWICHCSGMVSQAETMFNEETSTPDESTLLNVTTDDFYANIQNGGPTFGPCFQNIIELACKPGIAVATVTVPDTAAIMPYKYESEVPLHPAVMDACFQLVWATMTREALDVLGTCLPTNVGSFWLRSDVNLRPGSRLKVISTLTEADHQGWTASLDVYDLEYLPPKLIMRTEGLHVKSIRLKQSSKQIIDNTQILQTIWKPDMLLLSTKDLSHEVAADLPALDNRNFEEIVKNKTSDKIHEILARLNAGEFSAVKPHHQKLISWMKRQEDIVSDKHDSLDLKGQLKLNGDAIQSIPVCSLLDSLSENFTKVLKGEVDLTETLSQSKSLDQFHSIIPQYHHSLKHLENYMSLFGHKYPRANILEIGAETGIASAAVFAGLSRGNQDRLSAASYDYTDPRTDHLLNSRQKFDQFSDQIRYQKLDIDEDIAEQDFTIGSYDLIIASNTLHNSKNLAQSINSIKRLLKPSGKLLLLETTTARSDQYLVYGLLQQQRWLTHEEAEESSFFLNTKSWQSILRGNGFQSVEILAHDTIDANQSRYSLMVATAPSDSQSLSPGSINKTTIIALPNPHPNSERKLHLLKNSLQYLTDELDIVTGFGGSSLKGKTCIIYELIGNKFLSSMSQTDFEDFKNVILNAKDVMWVSEVSPTDKDENLQAAMHIGLLRTLRMEEPSKKFVSLLLERTSEYNDATWIQTIHEVFRRSIVMTQEGHHDYEFSSKGGKVFIPRYAGNTTLNTDLAKLHGSEIPENINFISKNQYTRLEAMTPGLLDSLVFKEDNVAWGSMSWDENMIEITPQTFGLNFRDVLIAMGMLKEKWMAYECAGYVTRIGSNVPNHFKIGDRVCAIMHAGHWANKVRVFWTSCIKVPDNISLETAASIPVIYSTSYHALIHLAQLTEQDSILIHSAAGGVGQAAIAIAQTRGSKIFATAGSEKKKNFLTATYGIPPERIFSSRDPSFYEDIMRATQGKGVDVVLNSLAGPLLQASMECLAPFGRFIELGKRDSQLGNSLGMGKFANVASYISMDVVQLAIKKGDKLQESLCQIMKMLEKGQIQHKVPILSYRMSDVQKAFRKLQGGSHIGKIVVSAREDEQIKAIVARKPIQLDPYGAYLIIGGLRGIGLQMARWMSHHGAKTLILLSRSAKEESNQHIIKEFAEYGTKAILCSCDVTDKLSLKKTVDQFTARTPIRGVIQSAVVLQDSMFVNMSHEQWKKTIDPKVKGTHNLHQVFQSPDLDFFIVLSSAAAIVGNSGQTNYTAAGVYQDNIANHRVKCKLPAVSINIGLVPTVGVAARSSSGAEARLNWACYRTQEVSELLKLLEIAIRNPHLGQMVTGVKTWTDPADLDWRLEPRFATLWRTGGSDDTKQTATPRSLIAQLRNSSTEVAHTLLIEALVVWIAKTFGMSPSEINTELPLNAFGVDSLVAGELRNWLVKNVNAGITIFDVVQSTSARNLATRVQESLLNK